ncbi:hypothetical protein T439DRAFT_357519 [Meredithblackwellia eburnea MCA 4105]
MNFKLILLTLIAVAHQAVAQSDNVDTGVNWDPSTLGLALPANGTVAGSVIATSFSLNTTYTSQPGFISIVNFTLTLPNGTTYPAGSFATGSDGSSISYEDSKNLTLHCPVDNALFTFPIDSQPGSYEITSFITMEFLSVPDHAIPHQWAFDGPPGHGYGGQHVSVGLPVDPGFASQPCEVFNQRLSSQPQWGSDSSKFPLAMHQTERPGVNMSPVSQLPAPQTYYTPDPAASSQIQHQMQSHQISFADPGYTHSPFSPEPRHNASHPQQVTPGLHPNVFASTLPHLLHPHDRENIPSTPNFQSPVPAEHHSLSEDLDNVELPPLRNFQYPSVPGQLSPNPPPTGHYSNVNGPTHSSPFSNEEYTYSRQKSGHTHELTYYH